MSTDLVKLPVVIAYPVRGVPTRARSPRDVWVRESVEVELPALSGGRLAMRLMRGNGRHGMEYESQRWVHAGDRLWRPVSQDTYFQNPETASVRVRVDRHVGDMIKRHRHPSELPYPRKGGIQVEPRLLPHRDEAGFKEVIRDWREEGLAQVRGWLDGMAVLDGELVERSQGVVYSFGGSTFSNGDFTGLAVSTYWTQGDVLHPTATTYAVTDGEGLRAMGEELRRLRGMGPIQHGDRLQLVLPEAAARVDWGDCLMNSMEWLHRCADGAGFGAAPDAVLDAWQALLEAEEAYARDRDAVAFGDEIVRFDRSLSEPLARLREQGGGKPADILGQLRGSLALLTLRHEALERPRLAQAPRLNGPGL